nr:MAG TPA: hypothetical protein [Crassvirales sp.]
MFALMPNLYPKTKIKPKISNPKNTILYHFINHLHL